MIYCINQLNFIGKEGKLLHHFKKDMLFFKEKTKGNTLVLGYKSFYEIGKPLPHRKMIVIVSPNREFKKVEGVSYVNTLEEALKLYEENPFGDLFICGGKSIYDEVFKNHMDKITNVYETVVDNRLIGDTLICRNIPHYFKNEYFLMERDFCRVNNQEYPIYFKTYVNQKIKQEHT